MPRAVRFTEYGGIDVLEVVEVDRPVPGPGEVLRITAALGGKVDSFIDTFGADYVRIASNWVSGPNGSTPSSTSRTPRSTG
jgi:hypothetical protein